MASDRAMWLPNITIDPDPMRRVREAQERGEEVRMVTGHDAATDTVVVFWHIVATNELVMEGVRHGDD